MKFIKLNNENVLKNNTNIFFIKKNVK